MTQPDICSEFMTSISNIFFIETSRISWLLKTFHHHFTIYQILFDWSSKKNGSHWFPWFGKFVLNSQHRKLNDMNSSHFEGKWHEFTTFFEKCYEFRTCYGNEKIYQKTMKSRFCKMHRKKNWPGSDPNFIENHVRYYQN